MKIPKALEELIAKQRDEALIATEHRADRLRSILLEDYAKDGVDFYPERQSDDYPPKTLPPTPGWESALRVFRATARADDAHRAVGRITLRRYPSKYEKAWRVEVSFPHRDGFGCGVEFYIHEDELAIDWEKST
ncbi:MAG: hypothetical protein PVSMB8_00590 [Vulcanimicrobiaceae bacterium]